jgi:hypothetical protein
MKTVCEDKRCQASKCACFDWITDVGRSSEQSIGPPCFRAGLAVESLRLHNTVEMLNGSHAVLTCRCNVESACYTDCGHCDEPGTAMATSQVCGPPKRLPGVA